LGHLSKVHYHYFEGLTAMRNRQAGLTLIGLILWLIVLGVGLLIGMKVVPSYVEFLDIKKGLVRAKEAGTTVAAARAAFDTFASAGYISSVTGKDLIVTKTGDKVVVSVVYEKKIQLLSPVSLLIEYEASSN
jgi:Tfp pilus assembly protein PilE